MKEIDQFIELLDKSRITARDFCAEMDCNISTISRWRASRIGDKYMVSKAMKTLRQLVKQRIDTDSKLLEDYPAFEGE